MKKREHGENALTRLSMKCGSTVSVKAFPRRLLPIPRMLGRQKLRRRGAMDMLMDDVRKYKRLPEEPRKRPKRGKGISMTIDKEKDWWE